MKIKKLFKEQLKHTIPLTEDMLNTKKRKTYFNGDNINVGDKILYFFLVKDGDEYTSTLECLTEKHFDLLKNTADSENEILPNGVFPCLVLR